MTRKNNIINLRADEQRPKSDGKKKSEKQTAAGGQQSADMKTFRMISKIEPQKRKGRYNIFINDVFAFGVDEEVLIRFGLTKGLHVDKDLQKKIENEDSFYKAYQKTLNYLSYSLRTEKQIKDYLANKELEHFTDRIIEKLKAAGLIDDLIFAQSYVRSMANINQKGPNNIVQDLKQKGVSENHIFDALEEYPKEQQLDNAVDVAEKQWKKMKSRSRFEGIQKVKQHLVNKGYSFEMAETAVARLSTEKDEEEEYAALVKQADKAIKRYARKAEGYELSQKLRGYLYSKGYPNDLINRYMDERESE